MGEIAEMMLDGTLDCETGEFIGDPCGYPRTTNRHDEEVSRDPLVKCKKCKRQVKASGLSQHMTAKHNEDVLLNKIAERESRLYICETQLNVIIRHLDKQ